MRASTAFASSICVGLAESGQTREEGPPSGRIKVGLDSYSDPDRLSLSGSGVGVKAMMEIDRRYTMPLTRMRSVDNSIAAL